MAIIGSKRPVEEDGPIAVRDFPEWCCSIPRGVGNKRARLQQAAVNEQELGETPGLELPSNFQMLSARDQCQKRKELFGRLLKLYLQLGALATTPEILVSERGAIDKKKKIRADLAAGVYMNKRKLSFDFGEVGPVPGVEVGDLFNYRKEMSVVGLHRNGRAGIACVKHQHVRVASAVVVSGGYQDDKDCGDVIWYTGQGGQDSKDHRQITDQAFEKGNLALSNSYKIKTPVRVIRGYNVRGKKHKIYSYDGLYVVTSHEYIEGAEGYKVHRFKMERCQDQPKLDTNGMVHFDHQRRNCRNLHHRNRHNRPNLH